MSNHEDEYKILIMIAVISCFMCIITTVVGILCCIFDPFILPGGQSKIKNIYTMHNIIIPEEDTL